MVGHPQPPLPPLPKPSLRLPSAARPAGFSREQLEREEAEEKRKRRRKGGGRGGGGSDSEGEEEEEGGMDPAMAAMMGFGGFGTSKK